MTVKFRAELKTAVEAVELAAGYIRFRILSGSIDESAKSSGEPVTDLDIASDKLIRQHLQLRFPRWAYYSEEAPNPLSFTRGACWLVDPLDGTTNATLGVGYFGVSIALLKGGKPVLGVTKNVISGDLYWGVTGQGFWKNGVRVVPSARSHPIHKAVVSTGFAHERRTRASHLRVLSKALSQIADIRRFASPTLDLCLLAEGRLDGVIEYLKPWDFAAGLVFLQEQGIAHNVASIFDDSYLIDNRYFVAGRNPVFNFLVTCCSEIQA